MNPKFADLTYIYTGCLKKTWISEFDNLKLAVQEVENSFASLNNLPRVKVVERGGGTNCPPFCASPIPGLTSPVAGSVSSARGLSRRAIGASAPERM